LRETLELFSIYAFNNARKEKIVSSLLQCNYRIFVLKHQAPQTHLPDNRSRVRELRGTRKTHPRATSTSKKFRAHLMAPKGPKRIDGRQLVARSRRMQTNIPFDEPADLAASIGAKRWPLFAQLPQAKALLSAPALTLKGPRTAPSRRFVFAPKTACNCRFS
jgi:hypothetical protein